mgnify:CR=1 FL=1
MEKMTITDDLSFTGLLKYEKSIEYMLYKLSRNGATMEKLSEVCGYAKASEIPFEKRKKVYMALANEMRAKELIGEEYFDSVELISKLAIYETALEEIAKSAVESKAMKRRILWSDFKELLAKQIIKCAQEAGGKNES